MKVLVVDDREDNRLILEHKLRTRGYEPVLAFNGADALQQLRRDTFQAVITDLLMPEMDGYQLTHAIKTDDRLKHIPIIIYTSTYTDTRDEALGRNLGASAYIVKPAEDDVFFKKVADAIAEGTRGETPTGPITQDEVAYLKHYTARLIHKLEDKVEEAARANRQLQELNATLAAKVADATAELREANEQLEAYVYSVSHDLRSPLRTIEGMAAMLLEDDPPPTPEERQQFLQRIAKRATQMQHLIDDLLVYSRLKSRDVTMAPVALEPAVRGTLERMEHEITERRAKITVAPALPTVIAFEPVLVQALTNLISNAIKFVPPGTTPEVHIDARTEGNWVRLAVRDNGIGIPSDQASRLFKAFERLPSSSGYTGSGVGLAIVKRAIDRMGGRLGFESVQQQGSTFWVELPAAGDTAR